MKYEIHNDSPDDFFVVEGETIEELQTVANQEIKKRGWEDCWSREVE